MLRGEPVFQNPEETEKPSYPFREPTASTTSAQPAHRTPLDSRGYKIIPRVEFERVRTSRSGGTMTVSAWVENQSEHAIRLDHLYVLGQKAIFGRELGPHAGYELLIYRGKVPFHDRDRDARLTYRLKASDDLFESSYELGFERENDGGFLVDSLHAEEHVRDV